MAHYPSVTQESMKVGPLGPESKYLFLTMSPQVENYYQPPLAAKKTKAQRGAGCDVLASR